MAATTGPFQMSTTAVIERLQQGPDAENGYKPERWTLDRIQRNVAGLGNYSRSGVWRWLKRRGGNWRKARAAHFSPDLAYLEKQAGVVAALRMVAHAPDQVVLVFIDEMGFWRWPQGGYQWMSAPPEGVLVLPCHANNRQWRIIGGLNAFTGQVNYLDNYIVGRQQVAEFYRLLDHTYPAAQRIFIVQDNWSIHTHADVLAVAATLPRLHILSLPTYAPWLNPIEKLWRFLRQEVFRFHRSVHDWPALLSLTRSFLDQFALGSPSLLHYVGLVGDGLLASAIRLP